MIVKALILVIRMFTTVGKIALRASVIVLAWAVWPLVDLARDALAEMDVIHRKLTGRGSDELVGKGEGRRRWIGELLWLSSKAGICLLGIAIGFAIVWVSLLVTWRLVGAWG